MNLGRILLGVASTSRPATSLIFAGIGSAFVYLYRYDAGNASWTFATTLLLCLVTFTANDIVDIEGDKINHPRRFLIINRSARTVAGVYYVIVVSMFCVISQARRDLPTAPTYILFLVAFISYSIIKQSSPIFKNVYIAISLAFYAKFTCDVAQISCGPLVFVSGLIYAVAREILMDIPDIDGDEDSLAKRLGPAMSLSAVTALSAAASLVILVELTPNRPIFSVLFSFVPILYFARMKLLQNPMKIDIATRIASGLPYAMYCIIAITS